MRARISLWTAASAVIKALLFCQVMGYSEIYSGEHSGLN